MSRKFSRGDSIEVRLWSRVTVTEGGCWEYGGRRKSTGYGEISYLGNPYARAHRVAYEVTHGPIPEGLVVMHSCDNPPCVNPAHLSVGTVGDNTRDARDKGRLYKLGGWQRNKTHCIRGHEFTPENTRYKKPMREGRAPMRGCRACDHERYLLRRQATR